MSKYQISQRIDISGPRGNIFELIATGRNWLKRLDHAEDSKVFCKEMLSGDYLHALDIFRKWFGDNSINKEFIEDE